jgi:hypothetical protein
MRRSDLEKTKIPPLHREVAAELEQKREFREKTQKFGEMSLGDR